MIKKTALTLALVFIFYSTTAAAGWVDFQLNGGIFDPQDKKVQETFGKDLLFWGALGVTDSSTGLGFRGSLGRYSNFSHHPNDIGTGTQINVTPLKASVLWHFNSAGLVQPYVGAGVGAYMYSMDDMSGTLESGTRFAPHGLAGVKLRVSPTLYFNLEYQYDLIGRTIFNNSNNFYSSEFTLGFGIVFPNSVNFASQPQSQNTEASTSPASIDDSIVQLQADITLMKTKRAQIQDKIDDFYNRSPFEIGLLTALKQPAQLKDKSVRILNPNTQEELASGTLSALNTSPNISFQLLNEAGWVIPVEISAAYNSVKIGKKTYSEFKLENMNTAILVEQFDENPENTKEFRRITYFEKRIVQLDKYIVEAQGQLKSLQEMKNQRDIKAIENQDKYSSSSSTTAVIVSQPAYVPYTYHYPYQYRHYVEREFRVPVIVPSTPTTVEERQKYISERKERIQSIKNR